MEMLAEQGFTVSVNRLRNVTAGLGVMLAVAGAVKPSADVSGRRIVVITNGGRVRLREHRRGKTKKGPKKFSARWRETRLFMIYAVDEKGRLAKNSPPILDGTLDSCDQWFAMMRSCLQGLVVSKADRVLFVADGAT